MTGHSLYMSQKYSPKGDDKNLSHKDSWDRKTLGHRSVRLIGPRDPSTRGRKPGVKMKDNLRDLVAEVKRGIAYFNSNRPKGQRVDGTWGQ